ncbi:MAG: alpha/beta fold hydrolase [Patescibacteria group bacterium]
MPGEIKKRRNHECGSRELFGIKISLSLSEKVLLTLALAGFFVFGMPFTKDGLRIAALDFCVPEARAEGIMISEDTVWEKGEVRAIDDSMNGLAIMPGAKLTVNPGVIIKLGKNTPILAMGELDIKGSETDPVIITSLKDDEAGGDTNGDGSATTPAPGDWYGIMANGSGSKINIDYAETSYGGGYEDMAVTLIAAFQSSGFSVAHSSFTNDMGTVFINETPDSKINFTNFYFNPDSCYPADGINICEELALNYFGTDPLDAANNYWNSIEGPTQSESMDTPDDFKGIFISGNINYEPFLTEPWEPEVDDVLNPVILVPGIMGSWYSAEKGWELDPILHTYDNLYKALAENGGYIPGETLFEFPYEWRQDNKLSAYQLKQKIDEIKTATGAEKVDIIAHSMGGLVTRYYAESDDYENDIDQIVFLGTPHRGSPEAYLKWEGATGFQGKLGAIIEFYFTEEGKFRGYNDLFDYIRNGVRSVEQLLPVYPYLQDVGATQFRDYDPINYPNNYPYNNFLEDLNAGENINRFINSGVRVYNIIGDTGDDTIGAITVSPGGSYAPMWEHGKEEGVIKLSGDGTVPEMSSSLFPASKISNADHLNLPSRAQKEVLEYLTGTLPVIDITEAPEAKKVLIIGVHSPVDFVIISPDGKKLGKDFTGNVNIGEIDYGFYSGFNSQSEFAVIINPIDGEYKIELQGVDNGGEYKLSASVIDDEAEIDKEFTGTIAASQIQEFNLNYAEESEDPIVELEPEDNVPPVIAISSPAKNAEYLHNTKLEINYTATDDFSDIASSTVKLDGEEIFSSISPGQATTTIDLFYEKTGEHMLEIIAKDKAGNIASSIVKFKIIATPDSVISDIKRLYELRWITDRTISKILIKEIEEIKWRLRLTDEAKKLILKAIEKTEKNRFLPAKLKAKMIERFNEELLRLDRENEKKLNIIYDRIERNLGKYLRRDLINQGAYDIIKDDVNYLRDNL